MLVTNYLRPKTLEEAYNNLTKDKKAMIIGGGAWIKLSYKNIENLISLDELKLNEIKVTNDSLEIGSMVTLRELETKEEVKKLYNGILSCAIHQIMGINIRNIATLGGSVMGRFPFSDIFPVLLTMNTKLLFYKHGEISLEDFLNNPKMEKDILVKIIIKNESGYGFFKKVAKTPLDFAIINVAITKNNEGFKISLGSTPYLAKLSETAMEFLNEQKIINDKTIECAIDLVFDDIKFSKNVRSSKEYKEELAKVYLKRGIKQVINYES